MQSNLPGVWRVYYVHMDRRLLFFPAAATVCWAQPQAGSVAAEESKQALIGRVQQYYQMMVDKKYRQAEAFVADDTKEDYYGGKKPDIKGFDIMTVTVGQNGSTATVIIKAKVVTLMMGAGAQIFEMASPTNWKIENGLWCLYLPEEVRNGTPFGKMKNGSSASGLADFMNGKGRAPEVAALMGQVSIDKTAVGLTRAKPEQSAIIQNGLPGPLDLRLDPHVATIKGLTVTVDKVHLESGQKATVVVRWNGVGRISDVVGITASPINRSLDIEVRAN